MSSVDDKDCKWTNINDHIFLNAFYSLIMSTRFSNYQIKFSNYKITFANLEITAH